MRRVRVHAYMLNAHRLAGGQGECCVVAFTKLLLCTICTVAIVCVHLSIMYMHMVPRTDSVDGVTCR